MLVHSRQNKETRKSHLLTYNTVFYFATRHAKNIKIIDLPGRRLDDITILNTNDGGRPQIVSVCQYSAERLNIQTE